MPNICHKGQGQNMLFSANTPAGTHFCGHRRTHMALKIHDSHETATLKYSAAGTRSSAHMCSASFVNCTRVAFTSLIFCLITVLATSTAADAEALSPGTHSNATTSNQLSRSDANQPNSDTHDRNEKSETELTRGGGFRIKTSVTTVEKTFSTTTTALKSTTNPTVEGPSPSPSGGTFEQYLPGLTQYQFSDSPPSWPDANRACLEGESPELSFCRRSACTTYLKDGTPTVTCFEPGEYIEEEEKQGTGDTQGNQGQTSLKSTTAHFEQEASIDWPEIAAIPANFYTGGLVDGKWLLAGVQYSLTLDGYDWQPFEVNLESPTGNTAATLTATPLQVRWDLGQLNKSVTRHNRPTTLTCTGPGDPNFGKGPREFHDWRTYRGYEGNDDCLYVWWGLSRDMGESFSITAEVDWQLELAVHYRYPDRVGSDRAEITTGGYTQRFSSHDWWVTYPSGAGTSHRAASRLRTKTGSLPK